jgi:arylsulfatase A-like enzyme
MAWIVSGGHRTNLNDLMAGWLAAGPPSKRAPDLPVAPGARAGNHRALIMNWFKSHVFLRMFGAALLLLEAGGFHHSLSAATRPNFIVVLVDDMGWADPSCFGNTGAKTPNVDRLAKEGIRFGQFYVNSPICSPSRCALITGQYPQRWKITSFLNHRADNERRGMAQWLDPEAPTLPRLLKNAGYATGHFGKWHLGGQRDVTDAPAITRYGIDQSLTNFEGMGPKLLPLTLKPGDKEPGKIWQGAENLGGPVTWMQRSEITGGFVAGAREFIDRSVADKKPFFINLWPDDVHSPFWPPVDQWKDGKRGMYLSVLENMDRQLGALFDHVRDHPALRDNTFIVFCSDNGPEAGAGSAGPFKGTKGALHEGGIRSPLIVWSPAKLRKEKVGLVNESSVLAAIDLAPSIISLAGIEDSTVKFDGEDVSDVLLGESDATRKSPIFWRRPPERGWSGGPTPRKFPALAVREGDWKLTCDYDGGNPALYDLKNDRGETTDLSGGQPEVSARLAKLAVDWHRSMPADNGPELGRNRPKRGGSGE